MTQEAKSTKAGESRVYTSLGPLYFTLLRTSPHLLGIGQNYLEITGLLMPSYSHQYCEHRQVH